MSAVTSIPSFDWAADDLLASGLHADKDSPVMRLESVGGHRFAEYADYFRVGNRYAPGTTLEQVWRIYEFDHRLHSLLFEAIGNIETQVQALLAYHFVHKHGPYDYLDKANFPHLSSAKSEFSRWEGKIKKAIAWEQRERPSALLPFPIWTIAKRMDFWDDLVFL